MEPSFWTSLDKPIIALSPMDGVTDPAFRYITDTIGHPDILFTEFTSVEGLDHGITRLLDAFIYHKTKTPTVAQIFGSTPASFYKVFYIVAEMGFDGIDINMGCPDDDVAKRGGGAALILKPQLAQSIIKTVQKASQDWVDGQTMEKAGVHKDIINWVKIYNKKYKIVPTKRLLPVSVKTRIGFDEIVTESWISTLLETSLSAISLHGRTLKQRYSGQADWTEIGKAAALVKQTKTVFLGNGDIRTKDDGLEKIKKYSMDGVLLGRATFGNPWIFQNVIPTTTQRLSTMIEHCRAFMRFTPNFYFPSLRKHLAWYCKGFDGAAEVRNQLMKVTSLSDVETIIEPYLKK